MIAIGNISPIQVSAFNKTFQIPKPNKDLNEINIKNEERDKSESTNRSVVETPRPETPKKEQIDDRPFKYSASRNLDKFKISENLKTPKASGKNGFFDKLVETVSPLIQTIAKTIVHSKSSNNINCSSKQCHIDNFDDRRELYSSTKKRHPNRSPIIHEFDSHINTFDERIPDKIEGVLLNENKNEHNFNDGFTKRRSITM